MQTKGCGTTADNPVNPMRMDEELLGTGVKGANSGARLPPPGGGG
jgi:hypothetical protein